MYRMVDRVSIPFFEPVDHPIDQRPQNKRAAYGDDRNPDFQELRHRRTLLANRRPVNP